MINFNPQNLDLLSVGIAIAAIGILGFVVYLNNYKSITNKTFLFFSLITIVYGVVNYLSYQATNPDIILWLLRFTIFFAVWHAFSFFQLFYVFPEEKKVFSPKYKNILIPAVFIISLLTLTPFVFADIAQLETAGEVSKAQPGPAIPIFGLMVTFLVIGGLFHLFRKTVKSSGAQKNQFILVFIGTLITFSSIIVFNFILPVIFEQLTFIPLAPLFFLPFIVLTSYAIIRYHLLNIKVVATEILTFLLAVATLFEVLISEDIGSAIFRFLIFALVLVFGLMLINSVVKEVKQRERLEELTKKLREANKQLKIMDRARAEFVTMASHQLRTPPSTIKWYMSAILNEEFGKLTPDLKEALTKLNLTNESMIDLIETMLNVSRIERGKLEFNFEKTNMEQITKFTIDQLTPLAVQKGLKLEYEPPQKQLPEIIADREKIRQVINNFMDNAIKYTKKGFVRVSLGEQNGNIFLRVTDTGKGIEKGGDKQLFAKFGRGADSSKYSAGLGLGLYLAKVVIDQHKGKIWAESAGIDEGSTFAFSLPIKNNLKKSMEFDLTKQS